ncbi:MAG: HisA/HisF-related TIM barrel protein [Bacillota bacterium]
MDVVGVIDIKDGKVVQAKAGERDEYAEIESRIVKGDSKTPLSTAAAFYNKLGIRKLYIADLDAIMSSNQKNNIAQIKEIKKEFSDLEIILDAGFNKDFLPKRYLDEFLDYAVIATESLNDLELLEDLQKHRNNIIISIDLKNKKIIHNIEAWNNKNIYQVINQIKNMGFRKYIILDLAAVGTASGIADYILEVKNNFLDLEFITGGGVKDYRDIKALKKHKFSGVLIATAFHNGSLGRKEVKLIEADKVLAKIAWCITGAGHLLAESIEEINRLTDKYKEVKIDIFLTQAGYEVLKIYKLYENLNDKNIEIHKDNSASAPIIGRLYKGHYDLLVCAPATSNTAAKYVNGISDTLVTNYLAHAGKSKVPIVIMPTDIDENLISPAPDKMVDVYPRQIDINNTNKLEKMRNTNLISDPDEVELWLKKYL